MCSPLLAVASELVFLGAAVAVALLLVIQLRMQQRYRTLDLEIVRVKKAQHEGSLDARTRIEEATKVLEALEASLGTKLEELEPRLTEADLRFDQMEAKLAEVGRLVDQAREQGAGAEGVLQEARTQVEQALELAQGVGDRIGTFEETLRDTRHRVEQAEDGLDRLRDSVGPLLARPPAEASAEASAEAPAEAIVAATAATTPAPLAKTGRGAGTAGGNGAKADADPVRAGKVRAEPVRAGPVPAGKADAGTKASATRKTSSVTAAAAIDGVAEEEHTSPARERMKAPGPGLGFRGALIVVIALAALVFVLRWLILVG